MKNLRMNDPRLWGKRNARYDSIGKKGREVKKKKKKSRSTLKSNLPPARTGTRRVVRATGELNVY